MVTMNLNNGDCLIQIKCVGGESLLRIQKALLLGISEIGSQKERSGDKDYQEAVIELSEILKQCMLDESQTNVGLGGHTYQNKN